MIRAKAIVDILREPSAKGFGKFRVTVWGDFPDDYCRVYTIDAKSDNLAAQEGINRFVAEIEALPSEDT
jgi:hypothetical protein